MEATERKEEGKGFVKTLSSLRAGQWVRLAAVAICLLGLVLYLCLPQIKIDYQLYDSTVTVGDRVYDFPTQLISGITNFFGGASFCYYKNSDYQGVEVLVSQVAKFNWFALGMFLVALIACGMTIWLNFTRKNEKWSNTDSSQYWNYYQLYVHDAYGALVSGGVIILASIFFGIGTSLEGGDKNDARQG